MKNDLRAESERDGALSLRRYIEILQDRGMSDGAIITHFCRHSVRLSCPRDNRLDFIPVDPRRWRYH
jgi:hypothetical protein